MVAVNAAVVAFVDELLRLPSRASAGVVVQLLYGSATPAPPAVLSHVNGGIHIPLTALLASPQPLAMLLANRLRVSSAWRAAGQELKGARAAARARYRELQSAFVASSQIADAPEATAALVRYTYGVEGRQWLWAEAAVRVTHRVVALNRAVLGLLASLARGEVAVALPAEGAPIDTRDFDLPEHVLDLMAASMPALAVPDWSRFASALDGSDAALYGEESIVRYQSLLAEILGRQGQSETTA